MEKVLTKSLKCMKVQLQCQHKWVVGAWWMLNLVEVIEGIL